MLTIQEIQSYTFEKAMFNGYDMRSVDELMERVVEDVAMLQKENALLKSKMKVLVEKIDEYRTIETDIRQTLLSAQDVAKDTIAKANAEAQQIRAQAQDMVDVRAQELKAMFVTEEDRLEEAKRKNAEFAARLTVVYEAQIKTLIKLTNSPDLHTEAPASSTLRIARQQTANIPHVAKETMKVAPVAPAEPVKPQNVAPESRSEEVDDVKIAPARHVEKATAKFDFGELQFGKDYNPN